MAALIERTYQSSDWRYWALKEENRFSVTGSLQNGTCAGKFGSTGGFGAEVVPKAAAAL
jgi:hypothetical protein